MTFMHAYAAWANFSLKFEFSPALNIPAGALAGAHSLSLP